MHIGYARVSTKDQSLDLQVDALKKAGCEQVYREVASGAKTARPVLDDVLSRLREGDVLVIWKLDRLGRSLQHLMALATELCIPITTWFLTIKQTGQLSFQLTH